jgi:hypothetical protein
VARSGKRQSFVKLGGAGEMNGTCTLRGERGDERETEKGGGRGRGREEWR